MGAYFVEHHIPEDYQFRHFFKIGASFDTSEALSRLFTEYAQGRRAREFLAPDSADLASQLASLLSHDLRQMPLFCGQNL